ncbi:ABC transporter ATP-binding protein [Paenibacillus sp. JCM 10914]|uniref:ABC transporter ATP-binding protein n=1 Tax=Paenibacillus sp. JCM 10914 TaxID=1236974 RepID=UPI0003CCB4D0|nr:ABC transporter ATP-binding protein [Paenibacillus sp. JCM 10914]GAE10027.1 ABC transporter, ATP-binding protein [Paenibacillus sp. JCM 10914]
MDSVVTLNGVNKNFGNMQVIRDLSFTVNRGEIFGLLGPNGAGKTTTLRMISCLLAPSSGEIDILGHRVGKDNDRIRGLIGAVTESPGHYEKLTALQNLNFFGSCYQMTKAKKNERIEYLLHLFDLWDRRHDPVSRYSKGMKQKLSIARALLPDPKVLLLDEATANLDPVNLKKMKDLVKELASNGKTIIYCSHSLSEIEQLCNRFAITNGSIVSVTTPEKFREEWSSHNVVLETNGEREIINAILSKYSDHLDFKWHQDKIYLQIADSEKTNPLIIRDLVHNSIEVKFISKAELTLEDAYLSMIKEKRVK